MCMLALISTLALLCKHKPTDHSHSLNYSWKCSNKTAACGEQDERIQDVSHIFPGSYGIEAPLNTRFVTANSYSHSRSNTGCYFLKYVFFGL